MMNAIVKSTPGPTPPASCCGRKRRNRRACGSCACAEYSGWGPARARSQDPTDDHRPTVAYRDAATSCAQGGTATGPEQQSSPKRWCSSWSPVGCSVTLAADGMCQGRGALKAGSAGIGPRARPAGAAQPRAVSAAFGGRRAPHPWPGRRAGSAVARPSTADAGACGPGAACQRSVDRRVSASTSPPMAQNAPAPRHSAAPVVAPTRTPARHVERQIDRPAARRTAHRR